MKRKKEMKALPFRPLPFLPHPPTLPSLCSLPFHPFLPFVHFSPFASLPSLPSFNPFTFAPTNQQIHERRSSEGLSIKTDAFPSPAAPDSPRHSKPLPFLRISIQNRWLFCSRPPRTRPDARDRYFSIGFQLKINVFLSLAAPGPSRRSEPLLF